jgi:branched-chain amino acid transport system permease protein
VVEPGRSDDRGLGRVVTDRRVRNVAYTVAAGFAFYLVQQWFWPAPIGVLLQGLVIGGLTAMVAFGIVLVYRSNRIINFAQGDLGGLPAALAVLLIIDTGLPYFVGFGIGLVAALALGALVEFVFIRRFFKAPRLILTVVTIGVTEILAGAATALPRAFGLTSPPQDLPSPFTFTFNVGNTVFHGDEVVAMVAIPVVLLALTAFFRYTNVGIAIRASADSADRAALLGVPVKRIQTVVWIVATLLAFIAIFLRAGILGLPIGSVLGPTILVRALAAAVVGRMEKFPTVLVASLALGVLEAAVKYSTGRPKLIDPIVFIIILGALLIQRRRGASRIDDDQTSTWQAARDVRPIPRELANVPEVKWIPRILIGALMLGLVLLPTYFNAGRTHLASVVVIFAMVGLSLVVLTGWAGQVSLGQVAFVGIGAAVGGYITADRGWDLALGLLIAGLAGALAAAIIGLPALRIQGLFLAVITLSFALATSSYLLDEDFIHWIPARLAIERTPLFGRIEVNTAARYYELCFACLLLTIAAVRGLRRSRAGRVLIGVRENPRAAQSYGVNTVAVKLTAFALSGFIAALAGALFVHLQGDLTATAYGVEASRRAFVMVVIGGLGSIPGALLGATFIQGVDYFRNLFPEVVRPYLGFATSGVGLIFVLLLLPGGFSQIYYAARDRFLRWVARRRGIHVPSLVADRRIELPADVVPDDDALADSVDRAADALERV